MASLDYNLTFAGVPFLMDEARSVHLKNPEQDNQSPSWIPPRKHQTPFDLIDHLNRMLPFDYLQDCMAVPPFPGRNVAGLAMQSPSSLFPNSTVKIGDWFYPTNASRWGIFRGLASSAMVKEMLAATGGTEAKTFSVTCEPIIPDHTILPSLYKIETSLYMLPPRPLAEHGKEYDGLWLVTLVDERWYFQGTPTTLRVKGTTTWSNVLDTVATDLGITLTYDTPSDVYGRPEPDSQLWTCYENAAFLLDAIAFNVGCVVVRNFGGTYKLQTPEAAAAVARNNRSEAAEKVVRYGGGDLFLSGTFSPAGNTMAARNAAVPATYDVAFPKYVIGNNPVPHFLNGRYGNPRQTNWVEDSYGDVHSVVVPISSGGSIVSGLTGTSTSYIRDAAKALLDTGESTPSNASGLLALAMQVAKDAWDEQVACAFDESYQGVYNWTPEAIHDVVWTYSARKHLAMTRVLRSAWNSSVRELQHCIPLSGVYVPGGAGGQSVAQTIRDSYDREVTTTLNGGITDTALAATIAALDYFPTGNRWKGRIDAEDILFEGTSGSLSLVALQRGIDGTLAASHANGATLTFVAPDRTYGVNLSTYEKGQFVLPSDWKSGGIQGVNVIPQIQSVQALTGSGITLRNVLHYSGRVTVYDPSQQSGSQFIAKELCWVVERNANPLYSGRRYDGQFAGWSASGTVAPLYIVNDFPQGAASSGGGLTSGSIVSGNVTFNDPVTFNNYTTFNNYISYPYAKEGTAYVEWNTDQNDYALGSGVGVLFVNVTTAGGVNLTGIAASSGMDGRRLTLIAHRSGMSALRLMDNNTGSASGNRFFLPDKLSYSLRDGNGLGLCYSEVSGLNKWTVADDKELVANAITSGMIASGSVNFGSISSGAISSGTIASGAVYPLLNSMGINYRNNLGMGIWYNFDTPDQLSGQPFTTTILNGGATSLVRRPMPSPFGTFFVAELLAGNTSGAVVGMIHGSGGVHFRSGDIWEAYFLLKGLTRISDATVLFDAAFGFGDTCTSAPLRGVWFDYSSVNSANWLVRTRNSGGSGTATTTTAATSGFGANSREFRIRVNGTNDAAFYIDNVLVGALSGSIPLSGEATTLFAAVRKSGGTSGSVLSVSMGFDAVGIAAAWVSG